MTFKRSKICLHNTFFITQLVIILMVQINHATKQNENKWRYESSMTKTCKLIQYNYKLRISKQCETINYVYMECAGYCESMMFYNKEEEISSAACCSFQNVKYNKVKLHCSKRLVAPSEFTNDYQLYRKDSELMQTFQNSFQSSKWTDLEPNMISESTKNNNKTNQFTGYYTILMATNASCECSKMNQN